MVIENTGQDPLVFKVKTTHPDSFRVQPKDGRLEAGEQQDITISPTSESSKPRPSQFRCVYVVNPPTEISSVSDFITSKESAAKSASSKRDGIVPPPYVQFKYLLENGTAVLIENQSSGTSRVAKKTVNDTSLLSTVPEGQLEQSSPRAPLADVALGQADPNHETEPLAEVRKRTSGAVSKAVDNPPAYSASQPTKVEPTEQTVDRKKADVLNAGTALKTVIAPQAQQSQEVPLHIAAILCLVSFLIGYMI